MDAKDGEDETSLEASVAHGKLCAGPGVAHAMKVRLNGKAQLAFGLAILSMLAVGLFSYRAITASKQSDRLVSQEVLVSLHEMRFAVQRLESTMRGVWRL